MKSVLIAGGGASGIVAAIAAAGIKDTQVTMIEAHRKIGKKILVSGNGRCNLSNTDMHISHYRGHHTELIAQILENFGYDSTISFFSRLGLYTRSRDGYVYPWCQQAAQVLEVLSNELNRLHVNIFPETVITNIVRHKKRWIVYTTRGKMSGDSLVIATGSIAGKSGENTCNILKICQAMGHHAYDFKPALVQLRLKGQPFKKISGVRTEALVTLSIEGKKISEDRGEIQLTDYGISGIPVFQLSRYASEALYDHLHPMVVIDFLPIMSAAKLKTKIRQWISLNPRRNFSHFFSGIFSYKLSSFFFAKSGISGHLTGNQVGDSIVNQMTAIIKSCEFIVEDTMGFANAQVCSGGIDMSGLYIPSLESRVNPGLFFAGEILDADGMCGGYNLQWAWSSGYLAGMHAALKE